MKLKVGFIGAGTVGQMHLSHWSKLNDCEIIALADMRPGLLGLAADNFGIPLRYNSHKELISNKEIEAVAVITRRHNTASVVYDCLKAGKHVFSEKPMAKTLDQAAKLVDAANAEVRNYMIGHQRRHDAGTQIGKKVFDNLMQTQELGKIVHARSWNFTGQDRISSNQFVMTEEERPEGQMWVQVPEWLPNEFHHFYDRFVNVFSHDTNILRYFFGQTPHIKYVNLDHEQGHITIFDFDSFLTVFEGGLNELNKWEDRGDWDEGLEIFFERGRLLIKFSPPLMHHLCSRVELTCGSEPTKILCDGKNQIAAFELQALDFVKGILQNQQSISSGKDTIEDLKLIESIWRFYLKSKGLIDG